MGDALPRAATLHSVIRPNDPERALGRRDHVLGSIIASQPERWTPQATEPPIWGLLRMVIAQQISTAAARTITARVAEAYPLLRNVQPSPRRVDPARLRACGLSPRKAATLVTLVSRAPRAISLVSRGASWEAALGDVKGVGPWTWSMFRIFVLKDPDVLPDGDLGLVRAVQTHYGADCDLQALGDRWRPFRSIACWYLWRSLGNAPLG